MNTGSIKRCSQNKEEISEVPLAINTVKLINLGLTGNLFSSRFHTEHFQLFNFILIVYEGKIPCLSNTSCHRNSELVF